MEFFTIVTIFVMLFLLITAIAISIQTGKKPDFSKLGIKPGRVHRRNVIFGQDVSIPSVQTIFNKLT